MLYHSLRRLEMNWRDVKAEESYKDLYDTQVGKNRLLESENTKLRKRIEALTRALEKLEKKLGGNK